MLEQVIGLGCWFGVTEVARHDILHKAGCIETGQPMREKQGIREGVFVADWHKTSNARYRICRRLLQHHRRHGNRARRVLFSEGDSQFQGFRTTDGIR